MRRLGWTGLDSLAGEIRGLGRRVHTLVGDVSRAADAERFVADALAQFGRIDVLVNNAAAPHGADRRLLWEIPEEAWDLVIDVNLKGTFLMSRAVIPHMLKRGSGRIISTSCVGVAAAIVICGGTNDCGHQALISGNRSLGYRASIVCSIAPSLAPDGSRSPASSIVQRPSRTVLTR